MQYAPHGVELQWQARERVAGDGAATALLLEKVHGLILSESGAEATFQVPALAMLQQRPDVTTDVAIIIAELAAAIGCSLVTMQSLFRLLDCSFAAWPAAYPRLPPVLFLHPRPC